MWESAASPYLRLLSVCQQSVVFTQTIHPADLYIASLQPSRCLSRSEHALHHVSAAEKISCRYNAADKDGLSDEIGFLEVGAL